MVVLLCSFSSINSIRLCSIDLLDKNGYIFTRNQNIYHIKISWKCATWLFFVKKNLVQKHIICVILQIGINTRFFYPISISCAPLWCSSIISITFFKSAIFSVIGRLNRVIVKSDIQSSRFYVQIGIVPIHSLTEWNLRQVLIKVIQIYPFFLFSYASFSQMQKLMQLQYHSMSK